MKKVKHLNINIFGKVHMVGFRFSAKERADKLGVVGFAQNKTDGSVYIEVEGKEKNLDRFLSWCQQGPDIARVKRIEKEEAPLKNFSEFRVQY